MRTNLHALSIEIRIPTGTVTVIEVFHAKSQYRHLASFAVTNAIAICRLSPHQKLGFDEAIGRFHLEKCKHNIMYMPYTDIERCIVQSNEEDD